MKTIFTLLSSLILSVAVFAADVRPKSMLTIKSVDRGSIRVIIDGRRFEPYDNYLSIRNIQSGYHTVKIYREMNTGIFRIFGKAYEVVYSSSLNVRPNTSVLISVDRFGRTIVKQNRMNGRFGGNGRGFGGRDDRNFGDGDNRNWDSNHDFDFDRSKNMGDYDKDRDGRIDNGGRNDRNGQYDGRGQNDRNGQYDGRGQDDRNWQNGDRDDRGYNDNGYNRAMNDFEFNRVLASIEDEWRENNKSKSTSQVISTNYFTTAQVKEMLQLFSTESIKLELAKQAYSKTVDQKNYFMINEVFSFNSSKDELTRFIRTH
jgi:hypothetical protein